MASTSIRRVPPPPNLPHLDPVLNRWFIDLTSFISTSGGIDPGTLPGSIVLNGNGPPAPGSGNDGDLYINNNGHGQVVTPVGLAGEGAAIADVSGLNLYANIGGTWRLIA